MSEHRYGEWDAAYLLGALDAGERDEFEAHLATCPSCTASVNELAGLPGILSRVRPEQLGFDEASAPPTLLPRLAAAARTHRRRRRLLLGTGALVAAGLVLVAALAMTGAVPVGRDRPPTAAPAEAFTAIDATSLRASARLSSKRWGTRIELDCHYPDTAPYPPGATEGQPVPYTLRVRDRSGVSAQVATWTARPGEDATVVASTAWPPSRIATVVVTTRSGTPLLELDR